MSDSHEPNGARIVPLFPNGPQSTPFRAPASRRVWSPADQDLVDRLLSVDAIRRPLPGEQDNLLHLRAVDLALSSGALYPHTPTEDVPARAAKLGLSSIEVMLQTHGEYQPLFIAEIAENARAAGVRVHAVHTIASMHPVLSPYARRAEEGREMFRLAIEAAATLDAGILVWHGPTRREVATPEGWDAFIAVTRELAAECAAAGVTLAIENVALCALSQVRDVVRFAKHLDEIGAEGAIGFTFDPFQAMEAQANPFMMLAAMGNRVVNVHISDYSHANPLARHLPPGDGDIPWSAMIRAIAGSGYSGPLMIEGPMGTGTTNLDRVRERLNPLIRSVFSFSPDGSATDEPALPETLPVGVREGIALFNRRAFYEQHELIEAEWHAERRPIRRMYQGLLQIGVGFHHALQGNQGGALALLSAGMEKLRPFAPAILGIDIERLLRETSACVEQIEALGPRQIRAFDASLIPLIHVADDIVESVAPERPTEN